MYSLHCYLKWSHVYSLQCYLQLSHLYQFIAVKFAVDSLLSILLQFTKRFKKNLFQIYCSQECSGVKSLNFIVVKHAVESDLLVYTLPPSHYRVAQYLIDKEQYEEAENIMVTMLNLKEKLDPNYFVCLHRIDKAQGKVDRKEEFTLEHGFKL